jgi:hypothetical protein
MSSSPQQVHLTNKHLSIPGFEYRLGYLCHSTARLQQFVSNLVSTKITWLVTCLPVQRNHVDCEIQVTPTQCEWQPSGK